MYRRSCSRAHLTAILGCLFGLLLPVGSATAEPSIRHVVGADPERGRRLIQAYGCQACHAVPGVAGVDGIVGPPLRHFAARAFIGGTFANEPSVLIRWIEDAPGMMPATAMPDMGVSRDEARDIAAYLYTLR
ncbi:c-type cytochrome [Chelatococcus sp. GCM10030263]|uniref:c-type cytochrome n=1 Tax=Chelatococcus sp. GCM10030263 TaxID=3273387 RepID=UPI003613B886